MSNLYFNEIDPFAAACLAARFELAAVDARSIANVTAADLTGHNRVHLFGGIGGWELALQLAGWPDDCPVWTGSCPCQPFSTAGKGKGIKDERHLWPEMFRLIRKCRPPVVFGEQVERAIGHGWLDGVFADLESEGYACGTAVLPACCVGAPHIRNRIWWVADAPGDGRERLQRCVAAQIPKDRTLEALDAWHGTGNPFEHWKKLLAESHVSRVANGVSSTVDIRPRLRAYGNAIVPQVAAAFIAAYLEAIKPQQ